MIVWMIFAIGYISKFVINFGDLHFSHVL